MTAQSNASDLVERLRSRKAFGLNGHTWVMLTAIDVDCNSAADEIERLRAQLAAAEASNKRQVEFFDKEKAEITGQLFDALSQLDAARKALEEYAVSNIHGAIAREALRTLTPGACK